MSEHINLLLVEDNENDAILLVHDLRNAGFDVFVERVETAKEMQTALSQQAWDAIISDFNLPLFSAPKALEILRNSGIDLPFIVVSGTIGEETAVEIMRAGAHDYLMKGNLNRLAEALRREIRDARGREERQKAEGALQKSEQQLRLLFERSNDAIFIIDKQNGRYLNANKAAQNLSGITLVELRSKSISDLAPQDTKERLQQLSDTDNPLFLGEVSYLQPGGETRIAELTILPVNDSIVFGIAHDITEQIQAANALKRRAHELESLYRTSLEINAQPDLLTLLRTIVEQAVGLLNAQLGELSLVRPDENSIEMVVSHNIPGLITGTTLQLGEGLAGKIALTGETMVIEDYSAWEGRAAAYENILIRRTIGVPLRVKGRVIGVISISDDQVTGSYTTDEIRLVSLFADQAAIAVENARLFDAVQRELNERKQAELALRESEERYRVVVTQTPLISFVIDPKGIFTLSDGKGLSSLGLFPGQVVGQSVFEVYRDHPDILEDIRAALAGESRHRDITIGKASFEIHYIPIMEAGRVSRVVGVAIDITERKKAGESLRESESSYRGLFNSVAEAIYIQDRDGHFLDINDGAVQMYGYAREEVIGKTPAFLAAPGKNDLEAIKNATQSAFSGKLQQFEFWGLRKNGEVFPKEVRVYQGAYFGQDVVIALAQDITARKQAEQALQRRLKEITILHNIARASIIVSSIDELVEQVTQEVGNSFYPDNFGVLFLNESKKTLQVHPTYRGITEITSEYIPLEKSVAGPVAVSGKPRRIADVRLDPNYVKATAGIRSELCVPIKTGEQILGVINAESKQLDFFSDDDEQLLLTIASQLAIAIERIRLFNSERQRRQEAETLRQATAALSTSLDLNHVLDSILTSLKQVVPYDSASVFMLEGDRLRITSAHGIQNPEEIIGRTFPADDELFQDVQKNRRPIILEDAQLDPRFNRWGEDFHIHGWMSIPLITRDQVIGYITLDNRKESAYTQEASSLAQAFAHQAAAAIENARLFEGLQRSLEEINLAYESTIEGWSKAMDLRDRETEGHTLRVTQMTTKLAHSMGIGGEDLVHIRRGALLHDIGKMGVPDRILLKPDRLREDELVIMRHHPQYAYDMLSQVSYLRPALAIPYCHHEHWDGSGYPQGLKGEDIPLAARLFAVVDVWDALTSDRPYRPAWTHQEATAYIKGLCGKQFDPEIVEKFMEIMEKDGESFTSL
jgi:PAS domain S-box-containing protein/putative nucleotidyltransferase with HDIG domain